MDAKLFESIFLQIIRQATVQPSTSALPHNHSGLPPEYQAGRRSTDRSSVLALQSGNWSKSNEVQICKVHCNFVCREQEYISVTSYVKAQQECFPTESILFQWAKASGPQKSREGTQNILQSSFLFEKTLILWFLARRVGQLLLVISVLKSEGKKLFLGEIVSLF